MLNRYQFCVLTACLAGGGLTQRDIAESQDISLGSVNKALRELRDAGLLQNGYEVTPAGEKALEPYRAESAVILAAGAGTRLAPLSFERPKALFEVRGEVLVERAIRQLKAVGVARIAVVVGYMKESFFYLGEEEGVEILVSDEYASRNNHASLWRAREVMGNTYILSADQYYSENPFRTYNFASWFSAVPREGAADEQVVTIDEQGLITSVERDGAGTHHLLGPAYLDRAASAAYLDALSAEYDRPETRGKLWEQVLAQHLDKVPIHARLMAPGIVSEFDRLTDLVAFDADFFQNVDSSILDNICRTLGCTRDQISGVEPIKAGLTNLSTLFSVDGKKYIYRHPGNGTNEIVNREAEAFALGVARDLGLDDSFVYEEPSEGWKISRYIEGCSELDYTNMDQVKRALELAHRLHTSGKTSPWSFDFFDEGVSIADMLREIGYSLPRDFDALAARVGAVASAMRDEAGEPVLCHNDFYGPNFLVRGDEMRLIDWEYAAMGDPAFDIGNFVSQGSGYSVEQTLQILPYYYGRAATAAEERHCLGAVAVAGWYWYVWAMYKEAMGNPVGEWLYIWYRAATTYVRAAEPRYGLSD